MKKIILSLITFVIALCPMFATSNNVAYAKEETNVNYQNEVVESKAYDYLVDFVKVADKEKSYEKRQELRAEYLATKAQEMGYPVEQIDKTQKINYRNSFSKDNIESAINLIVTKKANKDTDKFVVIGANYDNAEGLVSTILNSDGTTANGVGVSVVLAIMEELLHKDLDFNVEFVFFSASEVNLQGSQYYVNKLESTNRLKDLLLMINIWGIGAGDYNYIYDDEIHWEHYDYIYNISQKNNLKFNKTPIDKKIFAAYEPNIKLDYNHQALLTDAAPFIAKRLPTISLFSGNYTDRGFVQSNRHGSIMQTSNDTIEKFNEYFNKNNEAIIKMNNAVTLVTKLLDTDVFEDMMLQSITNKPDYSQFTEDSNMVIIVTGVVVGLIIVLMVVVYFVLKNQAEKSNDPIKPLYIDVDQFIGPNGNIQGVDDNNPAPKDLDPFGLDDDKDKKDNTENNNKNKDGNDPFGL